MKSVVCLDFDGVIHLSISGWKGRTIIPDPPVPGAREAIAQLRAVAKVVVHSGRCASPEGREAIRQWLDAQNIEVDEICENKPLAEVYVDDRAVPFTGDWDKALCDIRAFRHWQWAQKAQIADVRRRGWQRRQR
jgi:hypothetical protein